MAKSAKRTTRSAGTGASRTSTRRRAAPPPPPVDYTLKDAVEVLTEKAEELFGSKPKPWYRRWLNRLAETQKVLIALVTIVAVTLVMTLFVLELFNKPVIVGSIAVPGTLQKAGYSATVVARRLMDEAGAIQRKAGTSKERRPFISDWDRNSFVLPGSETSLQSLVSYVRQLFGNPEITISGEIVNSAEIGFELRMRVYNGSGTDAEPVVLVAGDINSLLKQAGLELVKAVDPYVYATYAFHRGKLNAARFVAERLLQTGEDEEQIWASILRGHLHNVDNEFAQALSLYVYAASRRNPVAEVSLGRMYARGWGVEVSAERALVFYRRAASRNHPAGFVELGNMYSDGIGVARDRAEAFRLYTRAAELGESRGFTALGFFHRKGLQSGVPDHEEAERNFRHAAELGHPYGWVGIGDLYVSQRGLGRDYAKAVDYYRLAVMEGDPAAHLALGHMYLNGWGVSKHYGCALELYQIVSVQGLPDGQVMLGHLYMYGKGAIADADEAFRLFKSAAEKRHAGGHLGLAFMHGLGRGTGVDVVLAEQQLELARLQNHLLAAEILAYIHRPDGAGANDIPRALRLYEREAGLEITQDGTATTQTCPGYMETPPTDQEQNPQPPRQSVPIYPP